MSKNQEKVRLHRIQRYLQAIPEIIKYQFLIGLFLVLDVAGLKYLAKMAIRSTGRVAISSGDFLWVFTTWQGWCLLGIGLAASYLYTALEIHTIIFYSEDLIQGRKDSLWKNIGKAFRSIPLFMNKDGVLTIIYITVLLPLLGLGLGIGLTKGLYIPSFITSVIYANPMYLAAYFATLIVLFIVLIRNIFLLHCVLLGEEKAKPAGKKAKALLKGHFWNFIGNMALFIIKYLAGLSLIGFITLLLPIAVIHNLHFSVSWNRFLLLLFMMTGGVCTGLAFSMMIPFLMIKLTQLYHTYLDEKKIQIPVREEKHHPLMWISCAAILTVMNIAAVIMTVFFDSLFPKTIGTGIIAHRLGGYEAAENTVDGLETSISLGIAGAETDVQRTKDGQYIILHDSTFKRLCGVDKKPSEMTLSEIQQLTVTDGAFTGKIATLEDILNTAKGKEIKLFIELKGATADQKMCDDVVRLVKEEDMQDQVVLISLKYQLIKYLAENYDLETSYLTFASFGDSADLETDGLALEEESATIANINMIHEAGKWVQIWTPDAADEQKQCLDMKADFIITDNVRQALSITEELNHREDYERIRDQLLPLFVG